MKKDFLVKKVRDIGLNEKEAIVYIALLEMDKAPASEVAQNARINRVTAYGILEELTDRGYIERFELFGTKHYSAVSPEILLDEAKSKTDRFADSLPQLLAMRGSIDIKPHVRVFEGLRELKKAYNRTLLSTTEILNFANSQEIRAFWPEYDEEYIAKRQGKQIWLRGLYMDDVKGREIQKRDKNEYRETRLLDEKYFSAENEIKIFDNKVLIVSFDPQPFAILIESSTVYETQKQIFEMVWGTATHLPKSGE